MRAGAALRLVTPSLPKQKWAPLIVLRKVLAEERRACASCLDFLLLCCEAVPARAARSGHKCSFVPSASEHVCLKKPKWLTRLVRSWCLRRLNRSKIIDEDDDDDDGFCLCFSQGLQVKADYVPLLQSLATFGWRLTCVLPTPVIKTNRYRSASLHLPANGHRKSCSL